MQIPRFVQTILSRFQHEPRNASEAQVQPHAPVQAEAPTPGRAAAADIFEAASGKSSPAAASSVSLAMWSAENGSSTGSLGNSLKSHARSDSAASWSQASSPFDNLIARPSPSPTTLGKRRAEASSPPPPAKRERAEWGGRRPASETATSLPGCPFAAGSPNSSPAANGLGAMGLADEPMPPATLFGAAGQTPPSAKED